MTDDELSRIVKDSDFRIRKATEAFISAHRARERAVCDAVTSGRSLVDVAQFFRLPMADIIDITRRADQ